MYLFEHSLV